MEVEPENPTSGTDDAKPRKVRAPSVPKKSARRSILPSGIELPIEKQRKMLADYVTLTAWWLGRPPIPKLPRRLEQVLRELIGGASEKQIARTLDVSMHTVHDYTKELHKRLKVNTRAELLNRFLPRG